MTVSLPVAHGETPTQEVFALASCKQTTDGLQVEMKIEKIYSRRDQANSCWWTGGWDKNRHRFSVYFLRPSPNNLAISTASFQTSVVVWLRIKSPTD